MKNEKLMLQLFAEGGEGEGAAGAVGTEGAENNAAFVENENASEETGEGGEEESENFADVKAQDAENVPEAPAQSEEKAADAKAGEESEEREESEEKSGTGFSLPEGLIRARAEILKGAAIERCEKQYADWQREAGEVKADFPDFDLKGECADPRFCAMLSAGFGVRDAYESIHREEIIMSALRACAAAVEKSFAARSLKARSRPLENGAASALASYPKKSVGEMTSEDIMGVLRRVKNGERVVF